MNEVKYKKFVGETSTRCVNLIHLKSKVRGTLYPKSKGPERCSMMLLSNLAEPEWIQISCTEKLLVDVICVKRTGNIQWD